MFIAVSMTCSNRAMPVEHWQQAKYVLFIVFEQLLHPDFGHSSFCFVSGILCCRHFSPFLNWLTSGMHAAPHPHGLVFVPWKKHALNVLYIHAFPCIKGTFILWNYGTHSDQPTTSVEYNCQRRPFSWNVIYSASEELWGIAGTAWRTPSESHSRLWQQKTA